MHNYINTNTLSLVCCTLITACTVLLSHCNYFIDLYCHMVIPTCVTLELAAQVKGTVLRILYTHACHNQRAARGAKVKHLRSLAIVRPPTMNGELTVPFLKLYIASCSDSHSPSSSLWDKMSRVHLVRPVKAVVSD
jgi:hypothetical protein